ncbi:MAG TPA: hypothetical protein PK833_09455 [Vicingus sp.]|nr:hypothetical protein [Vicingus sp.]
MELLELRKFFQVHDLLKLRHKLSDYFEGLNSAQKKEFIESVEFSFLPYYRSEISNTKARFKNSGFIQELANDGIEKVNFIEQWILEIKTTKITTKEDMFNRPFDGLFSVSQIKLNFSKPDLKEVIHNTNKSNSFDLQNHNIYDTDTKELIKLETQTTYNSVFLIRLANLYILDVKAFLNYHLEKTSNREKYIDFIKFGALNSTIITHNGIKECIKDWLDKIPPLFDANKPLKNYDDFIEHYQIFFQNLKDNYPSQIKDWYNDLMKIEICDIGHRAVKEIKDLLLLPNNNAETLKNTIKNDLGKLKKLHDEAIKEQKFFNAKSENNKYLATFIKAVDDLNIFIDTITPLIENKSTKIKEPQQEAKTDAPPKKDFKQEVWFKVAVLFASGKMKKFYTLNDKKEFVMKPEYTAPKIAKDKTINKPNYDKNILATLNNYETKKNIFNRTSTELKEVIKHCENKKIDLDHDFIERYNLIKDK